MKHTLVKIQGLLLLILVSLSTSAATLPEYYPDPLPVNGIIDQVNLQRGGIIIDDIQFKLSMNVKVHSLTTEFSSVQRLRSGMKIAYTMKVINGNFTIAEIWILPD